MTVSFLLLFTSGCIVRDDRNNLNIQRFNFYIWLMAIGFCHNVSWTYFDGRYWEQLECVGSKWDVFEADVYLPCGGVITIVCSLQKTRRALRCRKVACVSLALTLSATVCVGSSRRRRKARVTPPGRVPCRGRPAASPGKARCHRRHLAADMTTTPTETRRIFPKKATRIVHRCRLRSRHWRNNIDVCSSVTHAMPDEVMTLLMVLGISLPVQRYASL